MYRYIIERAIAEIGSADRETLAAASAKSNDVLAAMQAEQKIIQWEHSYVVVDKSFCVYIAENEALIAEHAQRSGFPATVVTRVESMIDPTTAGG